MIAPEWLWVVFTLIGATAQTFRNATQKSLTGELGTVGATYVRFLFGWPFGLLALAIILLVWRNVPYANVSWLIWTSLGAVSQNWLRL
jgi:hypothetical protein